MASSVRSLVDHALSYYHVGLSKAEAFERAVEKVSAAPVAQEFAYQLFCTLSDKAPKRLPAKVRCRECNTVAPMTDTCTEHHLHNPIRSYTVGIYECPDCCNTATRKIPRKN